MRPVKALSRAGRENQIIMCLALKKMRGGGNGRTAYDIAKQIDMHPNAPRFRDILSTMVRDGKLRLELIDNSRQGCIAKAGWYTLPEIDIKPTKGKSRNIPVKKNGQTVGQMTLWE